MLDETASSSDRAERGTLFKLMRLALGYILAIAAGAIVFALLFPLAVPDALPPHTTAEWFDGTLSVIITTFVLGFLFGLPYTILGLLVFRNVLPRTMPVFLVVGALCPSAAIATMGLIFGGMANWIDGEKLRIMVFTLPSGLIAAYLFGAVGLGYGFGQWRMNGNAA